MKKILVDTGPLVALLAPSDADHIRVTEVLGTVTAPLYTCWPVLTEAAWMLRANPEAVERLLKLGTGLYRILPLTEEDGEGIADILNRYRTLKPQLADAALVHLARREGIDTILTLDRRDFRIYRTLGRKGFHILP